MSIESMSRQHREALSQAVALSHAVIRDSSAESPASIAVLHQEGRGSGAPGP